MRMPMPMPMPNLSGNCTDNMIGSEVATAIIDGDFPVACCYQDNAIKLNRWTGLRLTPFRISSNPMTSTNSSLPYFFV